jgi:putative CocE/NonD family hydrolase
MILAAGLIVLLSRSGAVADPEPAPQAADDGDLKSDIPEKFQAPNAPYDYIEREVMIPMRDGIKLHTVMVIPKGAERAPLLLTRTPYDASKRLDRTDSLHAIATVPQADEPFVADGYIRVFQDVRGKYGSEGDYVMTRPPIGPLNHTKVDEVTDAWDTIDWLVKNTHESNGKVGMIGSSYEGFTVLMALVDPHPALKVAVPESPMVDGWMGDDWFHYGAFRQINIDYFATQMTAHGDGKPLVLAGYDDYENYLNAGTAGAVAQQAGLDALPFWQRLSSHPAYDSFWQGQALDQILAALPLKVPTMDVLGAWDQEDIYGGPHVYRALKAKDPGNDRNFLVIGPWRHSGVNYEGRSLGVLKFDGDTALQFRAQVLKPFLDQYLKDGAPKANTPPVFVYDTGANKWLKLPTWPLSCASGCPSAARLLYLQPDLGLSFTPPAGGSAFDTYVSDPAKPVPFLPPPVHFADGDAWKRWLASDQRSVADRTDVLSYVSAPLAAPLSIAGAPEVDLTASTTGTDGDWVVKLIDVYPEEVPSQPELGGYQLMIAADIFRGRYRKSFEHPEPIEPGAPVSYRFALPSAAHTFLPGHRMMVQIQSSWFPLYDRNPQTYVDNIFFAKPSDFAKATIQIYHAPDHASFLELPTVASF